MSGFAGVVNKYRDDVDAFAETSLNQDGWGRYLGDYSMQFARGTVVMTTHSLFHSTLAWVLMGLVMMVLIYYVLFCVKTASEYLCWFGLTIVSVVVLLVIFFVLTKFT